MIVNTTYRELYPEYLTKNKKFPVSLGTFYALKPFYVRSATTSDIEMCCCKMHLHARLSVKAHIDCSNKQSINLGNITNYETFFSTLTRYCQPDTATYISWHCTPTKTTCCQDINDTWMKLKEDIQAKADDSITVNMMHF